MGDRVLEIGAGIGTLTSHSYREIYILHQTPIRITSGIWSLIPLESLTCTF